MEKIKNGIVVIIFTLIVTQSNGQSDGLIRPGLIRAQATFSPSYLFSAKQSYFYLHGNIEGYVEKKISIAGDAYYSLGTSSTGASKFDMNHNVFFGMNYHLVKKNNDLYIGIQPGISLTKLNATENFLTTSNLGVNPVASIQLGYNYYVHKFFNFFLQGKYILGRHNFNLPTDLSEFRFSCGLGFNLNTKRVKN